MQTVFHWRKIR